MFGNLLSIHDGSLLAEKVRQGRFAEVVSRAARGKNAVERSWEHVEYPLKNWWDIPEVKSRWNLMVSGDAGVDYVEYFFRKHLAGRRSMRALSPGCGTGHRELELAASGAFERIDAVDISSTRIEYSRRRAREAGCGETVRYIAGDAAKIDLPRGFYDVVIVEQFLHHVSPLEPMLSRISECLAPGGFFIFNEFVGPSRFQWMDRQIEAVNALLRELPERYRLRWKSGTVKRSVHRPGRLAMMLWDPTEAVESSRILPVVGDIFDIVELKGYGGSVLQLLFGDIAFNFLSNDSQTGGYLRRCFELEDSLLKRGEIAHDFVVGICTGRPGAR